MKRRYIFFVLGIIFLLIIITLIPSDFTEPKKEALNLGESLDCQSEKIDKSILDLHPKTSLFRAYIYFDKTPYDNTELMSYIEENSIVLEKGSQLFDISPKIIARIPTKALCGLVEWKQVLGVSIPSSNK